MSVRSGQASDLDNEAAWLERVVTRLGAVERAAHVHPDFGFPGGIPSEEDIALIAEIIAGEVLAADGPALIIATGDPRWVNVTGDTMTGLLRGTGMYQTGQTRLFLDPGGQAALIAGTAGNGYLGFYPNATNVDAVGTRLGYVGGVSNLLRLMSEGAVDLQLGTNATERYRITSAGVHQWNGGASMELISTAILQIGPSSDSSVRVARTGNQPFIAWYDTNFATRYGYLQMTASTGFLNLQGTGPLLIGVGGAEVCRLLASQFLWGKTAGGLANVGVELFDVGSIYATRSAATTGNLYLNRKGAANATNQLFQVFAADDTGVGSVTRTAGGVAYNTASDGELKGDVEDLDDDEALARVEAWRPVAFRWKRDADGRQSPDGEPTGEVEHGFIAQEMNEVNPNAVTPGTGSWAEHLEWLDRVEQHRADVEAYEHVEGVRAALLFEHAAAMEAWEAECRRLTAEWAPVTESEQEDSGLIVVREAEPLVLPDQPAEPDLPELPAEPVDPGPSPYSPWQGDWTALVPDLSAAVQALIRQNRALAERIAVLENAG